MSKQNNMGTYTLTNVGGPNSDGVYPIQDADGVAVIALQLAAGGAASVIGAARIGSFGASTSIALVAGETTIFTNPDLIDGFTITVTAGTVKVITNQ